MSVTAVAGRTMLYVAVVAVLVSIGSDRVQALTGGVAGDVCQFPGLAVVVGVNKEILCTGVLVNSQLTMPLKCQFILQGAATMGDYEVKSGGTKWTYTKDTPPGGATGLDGTYNMVLDNTKSASDTDQLPCPTAPAAALYDGVETLDFSTCQLAGYGSNNNAGAQYSMSSLMVSSLLKSFSDPCCQAVMDTVTDTEKGIGMLTTAYPTNCLVVEGAPCGLADLGAPVMCNTVESKKRVTIALVASSPCVANGLFLAHDLTQRSPKTKYGVTPI